MKRHAVPRWGYNTALDIKKRGWDLPAQSTCDYQDPRVPSGQVRFLNIRLFFWRLGSRLRWLLPGTWIFVVGILVVRLKRRTIADKLE
jgi:hypothetical protein